MVEFLLQLSGKHKTDIPADQNNMNPYMAEYPKHKYTLLIVIVIFIHP